MNILLGILGVLGSLGVFLFGMRVMSQGLQRLSGERLRRIMAGMTRNRVMGVGTGLLVTSVVQSSSATTVMVVSFVNAGLLSLRESIGVIMGANLGTTTTFWIVSYLGLGKFSLSALALPIIGIGFPMLFLKRERWRDSGETMVGFGLLFMGMSLLKEAVPDVKNNPAVLAFLQPCTGYGYGPLLLFLLVGVLLTVVVQSSSVAGAITLTLAHKGWIDFPIAAAVILGENIGTTITANLASIGASPNARRAARAHFLFNVIGVCWMLLVFPWFTRLVQAVPLGSGGSEMANHLALFHSGFNLLNICVLIGFVSQLEHLAGRMVREPAAGARADHGFPDSRVLPVGELTLPQVSLELERLAGVAGEMYEECRLLASRPANEAAPLLAQIEAHEQASDVAARDIHRFLNACASGALSARTAQLVAALAQVAAEMEELCDCCRRLAKRWAKLRLQTESNNDLVERIAPVSARFETMLAAARPHVGHWLPPGVLKEVEILHREQKGDLGRLRRETIEALSSASDPVVPLLFVEILSLHRRLDSHLLNALQALVPPGSRAPAEPEEE